MLPDFEFVQRSHLKLRMLKVEASPWARALEHSAMRTNKESILMGVRRCPDTTVRKRIFWKQFYVADLSVKNHEMGNKDNGTAAVTSKANSITSKWGRLSWLLIWTGILTHLQVEAPESSLSTAEDDLTLDARTYIHTAPHTWEDSCLTASDSQTITSLFISSWIVIIDMFQEHNGEQGRRQQSFCSFPSGYVKTWTQKLCNLLLFESSETMIQNSPSICEPATFKKGNSH